MARRRFPLDSSLLAEAAITGRAPCTGCAGARPGSTNKTKEVTRCQDEIDVGCALALAGCIGCIPVCVATAGIGCFLPSFSV